VNDPIGGPELVEELHVRGVDASVVDADAWIATFLLLLHGRCGEIDLTMSVCSNRESRVTPASESILAPAIRKAASLSPEKA
jgi:hypothetical protein